MAWFSGGVGVVLSFDQIKELIELVSQKKIGAVEVERGGFRVKVVGAATVPAATASTARNPGSGTGSPILGATGGPSPGAFPEGFSPADQEPPPVVEAPGVHIVHSPIVGTFYRRPDPKLPPHCEVGDTIKKGQVLCIVEAMKLMNEVRSEVEGEVVEIFPEDATPVQFGTRLFAIRTTEEASS